MLVVMATMKMMTVPYLRQHEVEWRNGMSAVPPMRVHCAPLADQMPARVDLLVGGLPRHTRSPQPARANSFFAKATCSA
jgi:hypothetical protein